MNREIKFRVWDKVIPKTIKEAEDETPSGDMVYWDYLKKSSYLISAINGEFPFMQYIGFKDKNNKEIYEGDILYVYYEGDNFNVGYKKYVVKIPDIYYYIALKRIKTINDIIQGEVIGNIYDNPELI